MKNEFELQTSLATRRDRIAVSILGTPVFGTPVSPRAFVWLHEVQGNSKPPLRRGLPVSSAEGPAKYSIPNSRRGR